ncbi:MAG: YdeI/OmpD-associated family protein [Ignavibacteriaceae bacterium]|nr:YdeI/OmpD-associated family protein [Ignavibacteriaceae bacterium]
MKNHNKQKELWILFYKVHTKKKSLRYAEAVEESLCFGWIDGILKRIDDEKHVQRFTPRKPKSSWSKLNKERAQKMIEAGKMTDAGLVKIKEAKKSGWWKNAYTLGKRNNEMPNEMKKVLMSDKEAWANFQNLSTGYQNTYIFYVNYAKREETKKKRIQIVLERTKKNIPPGIM